MFKQWLVALSMINLILKVARSKENQLDYVCSLTGGIFTVYATIITVNSQKYLFLLW